MAVVMTTSMRLTVHRLIMAVSFLLALPLAAIMLIHPALMLDQHGQYNHRMIMLIM
ncbi:MAG TPA: cytochrome bd biosynthesis protein, partial [Acinetobacter radioresistens]|nr:cytochrome bd biosynthesis protein [Acinetobacter radioresistens]